MSFGFRRPSFRKRLAARTSWKRVVRHSLGFKAPRGMGWLTNPRKAAYNRIYNRTTVGLPSFRHHHHRHSDFLAGLFGLVILYFVVSALLH